jgi:uncharacterized protein YkwD
MEAVLMRTSLADETLHRGTGRMNSPMLAHRILGLALAVVAALLLQAGAVLADVDADQKLNRSMNPADFEGTWDTVTRATKFELSLFVNGTRVTGGYTSPGQPDWDGTIDGDIKFIGETMRLNYKWNSHKLGQSGEGTFYVHTDDRLTGGFTVKEPGKKGTYYRWKGKRISRFPVIDYGDCAGCTSGGGGTTTGGGGVPAEWADALNAHNTKRGVHRSPALAWDADLAAGAQEWANGCRRDGNNNFVHSSFSNGYGENLYWGTNVSAKDAAEWWYAEVQHYDWNDPITSYNAGDTDRSKEVRHFTQVVWKATTKLGCGLATCPGDRYVVCRYKPQGNTNGDQPGVLDANVQRLMTLTGTKSKKQEQQVSTGGGGKLARVIKPVEVFDAPGGNGNKIGDLGFGSIVTIAADAGDDWFEVTGNDVPGGRGFVYSGVDYRSLREE